MNNKSLFKKKNPHYTRNMIREQQHQEKEQLSMKSGKVKEDWLGITAIYSYNNIKKNNFNSVESLSTPNALKL